MIRKTFLTFKFNNTLVIIKGMTPEQPWTNLNCNGKIKVCRNCLLSEQLFQHWVGGCDFQLNREKEKNSFMFG